MRRLSVLLLAVLLSGCATQFGTRIAHPIYQKAPVAAHAALPVVAPTVVAAPIAPPVVIPAKPTFKQRLLSKFIRKRK